MAIKNTCSDRSARSVNETDIGSRVYEGGIGVGPIRKEETNIEWRSLSGGALRRGATHQL